MVLNHISGGGKSGSLLDGLSNATTLPESMFGVMQDVVRKWAIQLTFCWWHGQVGARNRVTAEVMPQHEVCRNAALCSLEGQTAHLRLHETDFLLFTRESCGISIYIVY